MRITETELAKWHGAAQPNARPQEIRSMCFEIFQRRLQEQRLIHAINILRNANEDDRLAAHIEGMATMLGLDAARFAEGLDF